MYILNVHTLSTLRLYTKGTDMNLANSMGKTALHAAVENGLKEIVDYLIDKCRVSPFVRWRLVYIKQFYFS